MEIREKNWIVQNKIEMHQLFLMYFLIYSFFLRPLANAFMEQPW